MRLVFRMTPLGVALVVALGCGPGKTFDGPTVDAFTGKLVADGKPVSFPPGEKTILRMYHQPTAKSWGIPIQSDGTFKIGWMPIGPYTAMLERPSAAGSHGTPGPGRQGGGRPSLYQLPSTFSIIEGKTEYTIDLGKGYKP
jgi:hypothetical protein